MEYKNSKLSHYRLSVLGKVLSKYIHKTPAIPLFHKRLLTRVANKVFHTHQFPQ